MKRILFLTAALLAPVVVNATDVTYTDKVTGNDFTAADANEIKAAVNSKQDAATAATDAELTAHGGAADPHAGYLLESALNGEAELYTLLSDVTQFYEPGDLIRTLSGTTLPGTCTVADMFIDTDADTNGSLYICVATDTWKEVDDDGGAGGMSEISEDTSPQLGGNLDMQTHTIENVSATEMGYLDGVTSDIQTQFGNKEDADAAILKSDEAITPTSSVDFTSATSVLMGPLQFEGATADDYETSFSITDPTADRTIATIDGNMRIPSADNINTSGDVDANTGDSATAFFDAGTIEAARLPDASVTAEGVSELATTAETSTGTDAARTVTPDGLSGSVYGQKEIGWTITDSDTDTATGDGVQAAVIPASMNGMNLTDVTCSVHALNSATGGATTVVLRRVRGATAVDMTSTGVTIAYDAYTASDETVNTSNDDLQTGDKIYPDVNAITTGAAHQGLSCTALFQTP